MRQVARPISSSSAASTRSTASGSDGGSDTMPKLIPVADALSKPFWDAVNQRRLVLQHCAACDRLQYPPQQACQVCNSAAGLTWKLTLVVRRRLVGAVDAFGDDMRRRGQPMGGAPAIKGQRSAVVAQKFGVQGLKN